MKRVTILFVLLLVLGTFLTHLLIQRAANLHGQVLGDSVTLSVSVQPAGSIPITNVATNTITTTSAEADFDTPGTPSTCTVSWGLDTNYAAGSVTDAAPVVNHALSMAVLLPGTHYFYKIECSDGGSGTGSVTGITFDTLYVGQTATPTVAPSGGTYTSAQSVTFASTTPGATLYYTTDGTTPTVSSTVYTSAIAVNTTTTFKIMAVAPGYSQSAVTTVTYTINLPGQVATPTVSPVAGTYTAAQSVAIATTTPGATIYYTTDGTTPTNASLVYTGSIAVNASLTIKALATAPGYMDSGILTASFTIGSGSNNDNDNNHNDGGKKKKKKIPPAAVVATPGSGGLVIPPGVETPGAGAKPGVPVSGPALNKTPGGGFFQELQAWIQEHDRAPFISPYFLVAALIILLVQGNLFGSWVADRVGTVRLRRRKRTLIIDALFLATTLIGLVIAGFELSAFQVVLLAVVAVSFIALWIIRLFITTRPGM